MSVEDIQKMVDEMTTMRMWLKTEDMQTIHLEPRVKVIINALGQNIEGSTKSIWRDIKMLKMMQAVIFNFSDCCV